MSKILGLVLGLLLLTTNAMAHCQMPCGIYEDELRLQLIVEDATTIEKAMGQITELAASNDALDRNQLARWVNTKEEHAQKVQDIVSEYFLTQRIKPIAMDDAQMYPKYVKELSLLHEILIAAMKSKQTVDVKNAERIKELVVEFRASYIGEHEHEHEHEHAEASTAPVAEVTK